MRAGVVPQAPQFRPSTLGQLATNVNSIQNSTTSSKASASITKAQEQSNKKEDKNTCQKSIEKEVPPAISPKVANIPSVSTEDPLGNARNLVHEEITREFAALMATGTLRASEAAALATRKVMERHGKLNVAMP